MRILRVFPRRTNATPTDENVRFGPPGMFDEADEVHVSVAFTWDLPAAERLAREWAHVAPVKIGGPATGEAGGDFVPGMYLAPGHVITSRGCPNRCWFCQVWRREGQRVRELPIVDGYNVCDDNLLACSEDHIRAVFAMLKRQPQQPTFTGGLEAARLQPWHADLMREVPPLSIYFAYDEPDDAEPLIRASTILNEAGVPPSIRYAYVLIGYPEDTIEQAAERLMSVVHLGFRPYPMLYRGPETSEERDPDWVLLKHSWSAPARIHILMKSGEFMGVERSGALRYHADLKLLAEEDDAR